MVTRAKLFLMVVLILLVSVSEGRAATDVWVGWFDASGDNPGIKRYAFDGTYQSTFPSGAPVTARYGQTMEVVGNEVWMTTGGNDPIRRYAFDGTYLSSIDTAGYPLDIEAVPGPATLGLAALGGLALLKRRR